MQKRLNGAAPAPEGPVGAASARLSEFLAKKGFDVTPALVGKGEELPEYHEIASRDMILPLGLNDDHPNVTAAESGLVWARIVRDNRDSGDGVTFHGPARPVRNAIVAMAFGLCTDSYTIPLRLEECAGVKSHWVSVLPKDHAPMHLSHDTEIVRSRHAQALSG